MNLYRACYRRDREEQVFYCMAETRGAAQQHLDTSLHSGGWEFFWMQSCYPLGDKSGVWLENEVGVE